MKLLEVFRDRPPAPPAPIEQRGYTDTVTEALIEASADTIASGYVAALEIAAGQLSRAFTSASVSGPGMDMFGRDVLAQIGRSLLEAGEAVWYRMGRRLIRADNYGLQPDGSYLLSMPSGEVVANRERVFHVRWSVNFTSGRGSGPLTNAQTLKALMQRLEESLATESNAAIGYLLPIPGDGMGTRTAELKKDLAALKGRIAVIETTVAGWGDRAAAPAKDYALARIGPAYPDSSISLYNSAMHSVLAACGYPVALYEPTDGTGQREAWRRYLHGTVAPLGNLVEVAADRIGASVSLDFDELFASDIQGRARAFQSLVGGGMDIAAAAAASGILTPEEP